MTNNVPKSNTTEQQKLIIKNLRAENYSYARIAEVLGLNPNTVKSICNRQEFEPAADMPRKTKEEKASLQICKCCGKPIDNPWNRTSKEFCSRHCRTSYWNHHHLRRSKALATQPEPALSPERGQNDAGLPGQGELSSEVRR